LEVYVGSKCRNQAKVVEHRRPKVQRDTANLPECSLDERDALIQPGSCCGRFRKTTANHLKVNFDRRESLPDLVVKLARDVPPLVLLGPDKTSRKNSQAVVSHFNLLKEPGLTHANR
jgi:hypothetical protein